MININNNRNINNNINDCGKNFRTPLAPLHRGGLEGLYNCDMKEIHKQSLKELHSYGSRVVYRLCLKEAYSKVSVLHHLLTNSKLYNRTLKQAFSLIELSIVLIIIGLLVAGVTGGKSLIESAKTRALMNEIRNYKQAVNTYYAANGRLPGDMDNTGIINRYGDVFEELDDEGIIDCSEPDDKYMGYTSCEASNVYKDVFYEYSPFSIDDAYYELPYDYAPGGNFLRMTPMYMARIPIKVGKAIDEKMDDGIYDTGSVLALNAEYVYDGYVTNYEEDSGLSYDEAMKKKNWYTDDMYFRLDIQ